MSFSITKRVKVFDKRLCAICQLESDCLLVERPKHTSFETFLDALNSRKDEVTERLNPSIVNNELYSLKWHRACYSSYTSKINVIRYVSRVHNSTEEPINVAAEDVATGTRTCEERPTTRSALPKTDFTKCIFCQQSTKKKVSTLYRISEVGLAQNLLDVCKFQQDSIFTRLSTCSSVNDVFAAEVLYHDICKKEYFRIHSKQNLDSQELPVNPLISRAFNDLICEVDPKLEYQCVSLSFLSSRLKEIHGDINNTSVDNRLMKKLLIEHYGDKILFSHPKDQSKPVLIFKIAVPVEDIVDQLGSAKNDTVNNFIDQLRQEIKDFSFNMKDFVCDEVAVKQELENFHLPQTWETFLIKLVRSGRNVSDQTLKKLKCVFMDVFHIVNNGEFTPKHVALAESIHHLTRSKLLITLLNRLGHCISYKQLSNIDNNISKSNLMNNVSGDVPIPSNILKDKESFVHGAIDNDDFCEETLDGKSTTHVTAMVLYQTKNCEINSVQREPTLLSSIHLTDVMEQSLTCQNVMKFVPQLQSNLFEQVVSTNEVDNCAHRSHSDDVGETLEYERNDFLWSLCRITHPIVEDSIFPKTPVCPCWTPFNQALSQSTQTVTTIGYCTMIPAPPTNMDTVYTAMKNFLNINLQLEQKHQVLSCDMAIYLIAKKIQLQSTEFCNLYLRIGTFHLAKIWLNVLGQYLDGSGIGDIFVESEIYGENTVHNLLRGAQYNRGVRAHKLMYEALRRIQLSMFLDERRESHQYAEQLHLIKELQEGLMSGSNMRDCHNILFERSQELFVEFNKFLESQSKNNDNFKFWTDYCNMVKILLNCIRADREGLWFLHLETVRKMIPYFFAFNHTKYVRGCVLYLEDMKKIPTAVENHFKQGHFSVKRKYGKFNNVGTDHALEQTLIRSSKTHGGVIGISSSSNAFQKWLLLYSNKSSITDILFKFVDIIMDPTGDCEEHSLNEGSKTRIMRDENDVQKLVTFLQGHDIFLQDFDGHQNLRNVINGLEASEEVCDFLLNVERNVNSLFNEFYLDRVVAKCRSIFSPLKRNRVLSFSNMQSYKKNPSLISKIIPEQKDLTFVFLLAAQRSFSIEVLVQHEFLQYPPSLSTSDGYLKKPAKSQLTHEIVSETGCGFDQIPEPCSQIHIIDGMALLNSTPTSLLKTFNTLHDYGNFVMKRVMKILKEDGVMQVDIVFDVYDKNSIKGSERNRRSREREPLQYTIQTIETKFPKQWQRFISVPRNKKQLIEVISKYLMDTIPVPDGKRFIISGGFNIGSVSRLKTSTEILLDVVELQCNHEEADTRVFFNARVGLERLNFPATIVIHSPDTDVFIIGIRVWEELKKLNCNGLWIINGNTTNKKYLGCHVVANEYGKDSCNILTAAHAFSGCDTTSKLGTKKAILIEMRSKKHSVLEKMGQEELCEEDFIDCERLYLNLLKKKGKTCDDSRYRIISSNPSSLRNISTLPATSDSFRLHVRRTWAQTYLWNNALDGNVKELNMEDYGYYKDDSGFILPLLTTKQAIPENLIPPCKCKKCFKGCQCSSKGVACCIYCSCYGSTCRNTFN